MFFVSFGSEIDTIPMMRRALSEGKRVAAPAADRGRRQLTPREVRDIATDLAPGAYSIREPKERCQLVERDGIDLVIVPAAVWSEDGHRIGYGGGYYDRFLPQVPRASRIGLGFEVQVVESVPHGPHDLPVHVLVTEARVRRPRCIPDDRDENRYGGGQDDR
jgi:5-formyltetrahydrofolate cyclo-ligase